MQSIHKLKEVPPKHQFTMPCANVQCPGDETDQPPIRPGKSYMVDEVNQKAYCMLCGKRLRYHRKKWSQRGEPMPVTLEEVRQRHEASQGRGH